MNFAQGVMLGLKASVVLLVLSIGLRTKLDDVLYLFRRPWLLFRSLLVMNVIMPLVAVALAAAFSLHPAIRITLVALALSPVPPILPIKGNQMGGRASYMMGLLVAAALFSVLIIPVSLFVLEKFLALPLQVSPRIIIKLVLLTVLVPLAIGMILRHFAPAFSKIILKPIFYVAVLLLMACILLIITQAWPAMMSLIGNGTILAILAFVVVGLVAGEWLGGPQREDRIVLALSTATRHPGIALAIGLASFPEQKLITAAILLYLLINVVVGIFYASCYHARLRVSTPQ